MTRLKKVISFLFSEWVFVFICSSVLITVASLPFFHQVAQTPEDKVFLGTHNNALDYPMFISEILQAQRGRWTILAKFTSEDQPGTLVHFIYIPLGKIGALTNLPPDFLYHAARFTIAILLSASILYFIQAVFPLAKDPNAGKKRRLAFLLALFSAGFPKIAWSENGLSFTGLNLSWWTGGDVLQRAVFQPHGMLKNVLLLLILVWIFKWFKSGRKKYLLLSLPAGLILGLLDPMNTISILLLLGIYGFYRGFKLLILWFKRNPTRKKELHLLVTCYLSLITYTIFSLITFFYMNWVFEFTPWKVVKDTEAGWFYPVAFWEYANHLGITFYLGLPGLFLLIWKNRSFLTFSLSALSISSMFFITSGITKNLSLSTLRFFQTPIYIFLAIATSELVITLLNKIRPAKLKFLIFNFSFLILFLPSLPTYYLSLKEQWNVFMPYYWNIYPDKKYYQSLLWLKTNSPLDSIVLSNPMAGNIIPAISGNTVYIGHIVSTINFKYKEQQVRKFIDGNMNENEAKAFLRLTKASYVILSWGEQERVAAKNYPFLKKVYENEASTIYKINFK